MFSPNRISLGELAKEIVLERLERSGDCKVQLHIDEDGEYIQIYGQGRVSTIYVSGEERRKGYVRKEV